MEQTQLTRGQFLQKLGLSSGALMAFYCMGTGLTSCLSSGGDDPKPGGTNTPGTGSGTTSGAVKGTTSGAGIDFTIDLTNADYSKLKTSGEFGYVANIIIANTGSGYVALSKLCTHQGSTISYRNDSKDFRCPTHGSEFNQDGTVKLSPATQSLQVFKTELQNSGNTLRVSA
ncbi:ubiquinol-cytochrome c reductase iron-sulfur subunit [Emticicia sp. TH156]|uniref:QcrA and Rieske domain-containing protein n=1 Tax=Emticicia sp. TH156 TaxID=2067454 RepID=UPI000C785DEA|nr:Rieske 2Fe-2S domain-containing protein [Emticicia sp. TH156]PLK45769.1 (2Fe-2S)-binding protein [Emticicia sp. TH156]